MIRLTGILILSLLFALPAQVSATENAKISELSKEERVERAEKMEKMADVHKKMAECLRSDKPMSECHDEMMKNCPMAKEGHCPMMEGMHGMSHKRGKGMMKK